MLSALRLMLLVSLSAAAFAQSDDIVVRRPVGAGLFYPAEAGQLRAAVKQYVDEAAAPAVNGRILALVVPQSMYAYSGAVSGHAYKLIQPGQYDRVVLLTPSNFATFRGCSIPAANFYATPLGLVPLDKQAIRRVTWSSLISERAISYDERQYALGKRSALHEREMGDEVQLPFLIERLTAFKLTPIVVGDFLDHKKRVDFPALEAAARALREIVDERTLIVVSTDFTQYGAKYGFLPFRENILEQIEKMDREIFRLLVEGDVEGLYGYLKETDNPLPGTAALTIMMGLLPPTAQGQLLSYDTSGRIRGDTKSSVSYASLVFHDPERPPAEVRPIPEGSMPQLKTVNTAAKGAQQPHDGPAGEVSKPR